jgi:hypothetical protein
MCLATATLTTAAAIASAAATGYSAYQQNEQAKKASAAAKSQSDALEKVGPAPTVSGEQDSGAMTLQRQKKLEQLRMGLMNTIKTSPLGATGKPNIGMPSLYSSGTKTLLGQ